MALVGTQVQGPQHLTFNSVKSMARSMWQKKPPTNLSRTHKTQEIFWRILQIHVTGSTWNFHNVPFEGIKLQQQGGQNRQLLPMAFYFKDFLEIYRILKAVYFCFSVVSGNTQTSPQQMASFCFLPSTFRGTFTSLDKRSSKLSTSTLWGKRTE